MGGMDSSGRIRRHLWTVVSTESASLDDVMHLRKDCGDQSATEGFHDD